MKPNVQSEVQHRPTAESESESARPSRTRQDFSAGGRLAQLASMMNAGPRAKALAQLQDAIQESGPVQRLACLAKGINRGVPSPSGEPSAASPPPAQLEENPKPNATGLPDGLKAGVESLSGVSLDKVNVHYNSPQPAQLNALAYAQGADIHVAPGQEKHLPHEAWHVVQQAQGRVRPTMQMKSGVPINDEAGLENEADVMGAKALGKGRILGAGQAAATQESTGTSVVSSPQAPVQRLVGFEVEYQVPTFGATAVAVKLQNGVKEPSGNIHKFLFGGLAYGTKLGGSAKPSDKSFRVTSDHNSEVSKEPIRAKLASMGKLDPADSIDPDHHSNLEYVTSPVDELGKGSDKTLDALIDKVATHATATFAQASKDKASLLTSPVSGAATGTPEDNIKAWLSPEDFELVKPTIEEFRAKILDSCYLQATVGILPRAFHVLLGKAKQEEGSLHSTGDQFTQIYKAIDTASQAVGTKVKEHKYIKDLQRDKKTEALEWVSGILRMLVMYLIGEAVSQTSAHPGGTVKNDVPFLIKVDPSTLKTSAPDEMMFHSVTDEFATVLAASLSERDEFKVQYWRDLGYAARDRKDKFVTQGSIENLVKMFLQGKKPALTTVQTGSQLEKLDKLTELENPDDIFDDKLGIPLEYRYIKERPAVSGLKTALQKIVAEAREINLSKASEAQKTKIEKQVKE